MLMGDDKIHDDHHTCADDDDYGGWVGFSLSFLVLFQGATSVLIRRN